MASHPSLWFSSHKYDILAKFRAPTSVTGGGGAQLYEAAIELREALRGRAALLVVDRTDIVDAAQADGVLLSPQGTPPSRELELLPGGVVYVHLGMRSWNVCDGAVSHAVLLD